MNKENLKVPKLRFKDFSGEWEEKRLGEIFEIFNGYAFKSQDSQAEGIRWVKIADVGIQKMVEDNLSYLPKEYFELYEKFKLLEGDYVVALTRPILNKKLKIAKIDKEFHNSLLNQRVGKLISNENLDYIYFVLQKDEIISKIDSTISGSDPPNLSPTEINGIKTIIPSLPEQQKIADFLSLVDEKIEKLTKKKGLLEGYKKGVMQKIFSQELRFKDDNGNDFPEWEENELGDCLTIGSGRDYKHLSEGNVPVFGTGGLMLYVDKFLYDGEVVCIGRKGTIDKPMYFNGKIWTVDTLFFTHSFVNSNAKFIYYIFQGINWLEYNEASGVPSLSKKTIEKIIVNLPSFPEQQKIADFLSVLDKKIDIIDKELGQVQEFKKGLLQQMFV